MIGLQASTTPHTQGGPDSLRDPGAGPLTIGWEQDLPLGLKYYLGGFLSLLPGFVLGPAILLPWYVMTVYFVSQKRLYSLLVLFIVWNFLGRGAFHYGLLGASESALLIRAMSTTILLGMLALFAMAPKRPPPHLHTFFVIVAGWIAVVFISAIVNGVSLLDLLQYYLIYFRWFLFALVILTVPLHTHEYRHLLALVIAAIGFNSALGVLQQYVLPVQITPAGYVPDYFDLPSGLLGVTFSQHLTALCMVLATLFVIRYSKTGGMRNLFGSVVFALQPFTSSSKAIMFLMVTLMVAALAYAHRKDLFKKGTLLLRMGVLVLGGWIGISVYIGFNEEIHGSLEDQLAAVTEKMGSIDDFKKLMGYVNVVNDVAPWGAAGLWLGVGPGQFLNAVSGNRETRFSGAIEVGTEELDLSSFEKQDTEMVATIGELGMVGCALQSLAMASLLVSIARRLGEVQSVRLLSFRISVAVMAFATIFLTWYTQAWSIAFYYVPLFIMLVYDMQCESGDPRTSVPMASSFSGDAELQR